MTLRRNGSIFSRRAGRLLWPRFAFPNRTPRSEPIVPDRSTLDWQQIVVHMIAKCSPNTSKGRREERVGTAQGPAACGRAASDRTSPEE